MENIVINTVEMHTGGEPLRIIKSGYPEIVGKTILDKRKFVKDNLDALRKFIIYEPRGHYDMYGAVQVVPDIPNADVAFLFTHNEGYSTMCGHAIVALGRYCVDNKLVPYKEPETEINIQCPCGLVKAFVNCANGLTSSVRFRSVPSFTVKSDIEVSVPAYGTLKVDLAYGGAFYAFLPLNDVGLNKNSPIEQIRSAASTIASVVKAQEAIVHPESADLSYLYGVIFTDNMTGPYFNLTVFADAQVDRSPCGSGSTARVALLHHKKLIGLDESVEIENPLTNSSFKATAVEETHCGEYSAVRVEICGNAYYTGTATFTAEAQDGLKEGFLIA
ncbi:trans-L-3-hydroxyproline dehydratase-like [Clavelina lepadiformis]|uniref:trans-L-3-hydroxyproline dehydratase-like n=1 Tax=Clavelina lepadiformis TaxID=159417 RepID=UPI004040EC9F